MAPKIGPMSERQKRLENARRIAADIELPMRRFFAHFLKINPHQITPETFADLQSDADELNESIRRCAQSLYDLIEHVGSEPADLLASIRNRKT